MSYDGCKPVKNRRFVTQRVPPTLLRRDQNNIDLMMLQGHDFLGAVRLLKIWLDQYRHDIDLPTQSATPRSSQDK